MHSGKDMPDGWLYFNKEALRCRPGLTLADLLARKGLAPNQVTTAVNGTFVPREQRTVTRLKVGDEVLTFQAIVGG